MWHWVMPSVLQFVSPNIQAQSALFTSFGDVAKQFNQTHSDIMCCEEEVVWHHVWRSS
jgi:hypothetical protein